jgi:hypothetical protein
MIDGFSRRSVILFVIAMIAATAFTIEGTYYVITRLVAFYDPNDPLTKSGGLSPEQQGALKAKRN